MTETLRLSYICEGVERRADLIREPCKLDEETWDFLKGAFIAIGFAQNQVNDFFDEPSDDKSDE